MSLGDCFRCDDAVCTCGNCGYVVVSPRDPRLLEKLKWLGSNRLDREIVSKLRVALEALLDEVADGTVQPIGFDRSLNGTRKT